MEGVHCIQIYKFSNIFVSCTDSIKCTYTYIEQHFSLSGSCGCLKQFIVKHFNPYPANVDKMASPYQC